MNRILYRMKRDLGSNLTSDTMPQAEVDNSVYSSVSDED